jgi:hypothetical protein
VIDASLENAASVTVGGDLDTVRCHGVVDELTKDVLSQSVHIPVRSSADTHLVVLRYQTVETLLDDVVAVQVLDQTDDVQAEREDD